MNDELRYCTHEGQYTWREFDARGIYLDTVCDKCVKAKLSRYRQNVLHNPDYVCDEPIYPDEY